MTIGQLPTTQGRSINKQANNKSNDSQWLSWRAPFWNHSFQWLLFTEGENPGSDLHVTSLLLQFIVEFARQQPMDIDDLVDLAHVDMLREQGRLGWTFIQTSRSMLKLVQQIEHVIHLIVDFMLLSVQLAGIMMVLAWWEIGWLVHRMGTHAVHMSIMDGIGRRRRFAWQWNFLWPLTVGLGGRGSSVVGTEWYVFIASYTMNGNITEVLHQSIDLTAFIVLLVSSVVTVNGELVVRLNVTRQNDMFHTGQFGNLDFVYFGMQFSIQFLWISISIQVNSVCSGLTGNISVLLFNLNIRRIFQYTRIMIDFRLFNRGGIVLFRCLFSAP